MTLTKLTIALLFLLCHIDLDAQSRREINYIEQDGIKWKEVSYYCEFDSREVLARIELHRDAKLWESKVFYEIWPNEECKFVSEEGFMKFSEGKSHFPDSVYVPDNIIIHALVDGKPGYMYYKDGKKVPYRAGKVDGTVEFIIVGDEPGVYEWKDGKKHFVRPLGEKDKKAPNK